MRSFATVTPGGNNKLFCYGTDNRTKQAEVFATGKYLQPSGMFVGKARSLTQRVGPKRSTRDANCDCEAKQTMTIRLNLML
jgi:hypothetical protein